MIEHPSEPLLEKAARSDKATYQELLRIQATALLNRQVREQGWMGLLTAGMLVLVGLQTTNLLTELGRINLQSAGIIAWSQFAILAVAVLVGLSYFLGRLRLVRSEMSLLRLKLEMLAPDEEAPEESPTGSLSKQRSIRRSTNIDPDR